ncbi:MAG: MFS transporter [Candidatus Binatia bacterium]
MPNVKNILDSIRALGPERLKVLSVITGGHFAIHWFQQLFPVVLPSIKSGLALNDVQVGALTAARQLVHGTLDFPLGMVADAMVRYRAILLATALVSMGVGYTFIGISSAFVLALCGAGLVGLGTALWHPAAAASLSNRFPERRATALSVHGMGATVSDTLTPLGVGALLIAFPWEKLLALQLVPGMLVGFFIWRGLTGLFTEGEAHASRSTQLREILALARHPVFLGISAAKGLAMMGRLIVITFLPIYLQEQLGYSPFALGFFIALLHAMGTISQPVLGFLSDRLGRKAVLFPSFIMQGALFALLGVVPAGLPLSVVIAANGLFFYTLMNITYAAVMDVAGSQIQASSYGLASLVTEIVVVPTPILAGVFIGQYGVNSAFVLAGGFVFLAGFILLPLNLYRGSKDSGPS